ncbi:hypothetical protein C8R44DRAFT_872922 [Mycena epipterygia]|nr:hypothetical protein C8R44DRAFT_872922 [Mycena epipterygia]
MDDQAPAPPRAPTAPSGTVVIPPPRPPTPPPHVVTPPPRPPTTPPRIPTPPPGPDTPPRVLTPPPGPDTTPPSPRPPTPATDVPPVPRRIVKRVTEKKPRHRKGDPTEKPGKVSWVYGTKLPFFSKRKDKWLGVTKNKNQVGGFYTKMARLFILKYGYIADDEDLDAEVEDPDEELTNHVVHEKVSDEEGAFRAKYYNKLRERIGAWYQDQYNGILKEDKTAFADLFKGALSGATQDEYTGDMLENEVKVRVEITKEAWDDESLEFQEEVLMALERDYELAIKAWEASLADSPTCTPEEMAVTLGNAAHFLQPYADVISKRFGMCVSVLLAGPIGKKGGAIGVQSVHAGMTRGVAPVKWPAFDVAGFHEVEKSMIAFAKEHFTEAECRARTLEGTRAPPPPLPAPRLLAPLPATSLMTPPSTTPSSTTPPLAPTGQDPLTPVAPKPTSATGEQLSHVTSNPGNCVGEEEEMAVHSTEGGQEGGGGEESAEEKEKVEIEEVWHRDDREEWTAELARAHTAFERGKGWGVEWGKCVSAFFDFEGAWGYTTTGAMIKTEGRLKEVSVWLGRGRKWNSSPAIGMMGTQARAGSFVGMWWSWWASLQLAEREMNAGILTCPSEADWSALAKLHGNNGLMHVMATLLWWGDGVGDQEKDEEQYMDWSLAVSDVTYALQEMLAAAEAIIMPKNKRKRVMEEAEGSRKKTRSAKSRETAEKEPRRGRSRADPVAKAVAKAPKTLRPKPKAIPRGGLRSIRPE